MKAAMNRTSSSTDPSHNHHVVTTTGWMVGGEVGQDGSGEQLYRGQSKRPDGNTQDTPRNDIAANKDGQSKGDDDDCNGDEDGILEDP